MKILMSCSARRDYSATHITGQPVCIRLNRDYIRKAVDLGLLNLDLYDELTPVVFHHGGQRMVIMPIRPDPGPAAAPTPKDQAGATTENKASTPPPANTETTLPPNPETNNQTTNPTQERNPMPKTTETPTAETSANGAESPVKSLVQHIEQIKESLKGVIRDMNDLLDLVKKTEKEKKTSEKEIEAVREKLREIQSVKI